MDHPWCHALGRIGFGKSSSLSQLVAGKKKRKILHGCSICIVRCYLSRATIFTHICPDDFVWSPFSDHNITITLEMMFLGFYQLLVDTYLASPFPRKHLHALCVTTMQKRVLAHCCVNHLISGGGRDYLSGSCGGYG